ncbi:hypothetical protein M407DRAFT_26560 [Tulasnella calospora MUT 4182]|uniref:F-box domain-containing protein n=1 Tax=Tulasnella calospora MUT 4182 TaxID=1051891 RepID=A0A0C3QE28_9AGAM|nr:hypothetical protein M407DRAFT_26560 [Tulasnella calospora MUT 4182]
MSDQAPLNIRHIGKYADGPESPFLDRVLPHSHHWESVTIHQPNTDVATKYFSLPAPIIKSILLSIVGGGIPQPGGLGSLFGGGLENLEELRVASCGSVGWRGLSCTRLRWLEIGGENCLDMGVMLDIVAANPNLEVIRMHNLSFAQLEQPSPSPAPIRLENLKELTLKDITHITEDGYLVGRDVPIVHLFQRIQFRPGTAFTMKERVQPDSFVPPEKFIGLIPNPVEALGYLSQIDDSQSVGVNAKFGGQRLQLEIQNASLSKPIFSVDMHGLPRALAKNWVVEALEGATTTPIDFRLHFGNEERGLSLEEVLYFQLWESVKDLSVDGNWQCPLDFGRGLLQLLSTRCVSDDGSLVMPFPKLQHLRLSGLSGIKARDMLEMVRTRFALPGSTEAAVDWAVPVPMTIYFGNGVGGWRNKCMDDILATPGVKGVKGYEESASGSSSSSSTSQWPPPYDYYHYQDGISDWDDSEISLHNSDAELSLHDSNAEDAEDDVDDI